MRSNNCPVGLADNQGTVRDFIDSSGDVEDHIAYDSFGQPLAHTASDPAVLDFLFVHAGSPLYDRTTGLEHDGQRWYDSLIDAGSRKTPAGLGPDANPYRPVGNSPTNYADPNGLGLLQRRPVGHTARPLLDHRLLPCRKLKRG